MGVDGDISRSDQLAKVRALSCDLPPTVSRHLLSGDLCNYVSGCPDTERPCGERSEVSV